MKKLVFVVLFCVVVNFYFMAEADQKKDVVVLDPIYVSPLRTDVFESKTPASVDLITQEDIKNAHAQTTVDLLRSRPGITVRDWTGNGTTASVDIRGFGEQAGLNVAVLIDGRKVNEVDLSAVDWAQIPISRIEKIEIIRGGEGAVLYGDNAVSGVINIITKKGEGDPFFEYEQTYGSYDMNEERINLGGLLHGLSYYFTVGRKGTHGYRNNSYFDDIDFASKLEYEINDDTRLRFSQSWHKMHYGLPGALASADQEAHNRKFSDFGNDYAKRTDWNFVGGFDKGLWGWGELSSDFSFRRRDTYTNFVGANAGWNPILRSRIDTVGITPKYVLDKEIFGCENVLVTGLDFYRSDFNSNNYNSNGTIQNLTAINKSSIAWYGQDSFSVLSQLEIVGGYRYELADYDFDYQDLAVWFPNPRVDDRTKRTAHAYNTGVVFEYIEGSEAFFDYNQSFRMPVTDEFLSWGTLNLGLTQQESVNYEAGIRHRFSDKVKCSVSGFWMNVENELYYNPTGGPGGWGANETYDKTIHRGIEASAEAYFGKWGQAFVNYTFTDAIFDDDLYTGRRLPMVPRNQGSGGGRLFFLENFTLNITGNIVGSRYFLNDEENRYPQLKPYFTLDTNLFYKFRNLTIGAGVNNIFNEKYYEYGVRNATTGACNYYPAAGTNFYVEGKVKFG